MCGGVRSDGDMCVPFVGHRSSMPSSTAAEIVHHTQMEGLGEVVRKRINVGKYFLSQE